MSDIPASPTREEVTEHQRSFFTFERLVLFAVIHVALTLACLALAFLGHEHLLGLLFWLAGTVVLISTMALTTDWSPRP